MAELQYKIDFAFRHRMLLKAEAENGIPAGTTQLRNAHATPIKPLALFLAEKRAKKSPRAVKAFSVIQKVIGRLGLLRCCFVISKQLETRFTLLEGEEMVVLVQRLKEPYSLAPPQSIEEACAEKADPDLLKTDAGPGMSEEKCEGDRGRDHLVVPADGRVTGHINRTSQGNRPSKEFFCYRPLGQEALWQNHELQALNPQLQSQLALEFEVQQGVNIDPAAGQDDDNAHGDQGRDVPSVVPLDDVSDEDSSEGMVPADIDSLSTGTHSEDSEQFEDHQQVFTNDKEPYEQYAPAPLPLLSGPQKRKYSPDNSMPQDFDSTVQASGVQFQLDEDNTYIFKNKLARLGPELPLLGNPNLTSLNSTADINTQVHKQVEVHPTTQVDESRLDNPDIELNIVPGLESLQLQGEV
eukprot:tig00022075_g23665.t1